MTPARPLYGAAGLLAALGLALRAAPPRVPAATTHDAVFAGPTAPPGMVQDSAGATSYAAIVATDIFSQRRTPPSVRFAPVGASRAPSSGALPHRPTLTLYGITLGPQGAVALIDADPRVRGAELFGVGDLVAGARLVAISESTVTLAKPSGPLVLHLQSSQRKQP